MVKRRKILVLPLAHPNYNPKTDEPLRYFPVKDTFVRCSPKGNYSLYCGRWLVLKLERHGYLCTFPSFKQEHTTYADAFLHDYAPTISIDQLKPYLGKTHAEYIGTPT